MSGGWIDALPDWFAGFAWPWLLAALPLPWLVRWAAPAVDTASAALRAPWPGRLAAIGMASAPSGVRGMPVLALLAWTLLCVAAARPQYFGDVARPPQSGRDLMLAVDLSGSMSEEDMRLGGRQVDRLTAAKAVLADFLDRREGDRVGLIVFGQRAYALAPLTLDRDSVREQLVDSVVGLAGRETAIGDAIGLAVKRFDAQAAPQRVLVLLTDGVNTAGMLDPIKAADIAQDAGVRIHAIAFGGDAQASLFGLRLPATGMELDEATLARIATTTGGRSFRARDVDDLAGIYNEIDRLEPVSREGVPVRPRLEGYPWPLAAALLGALLALLPLRWPNRLRLPASGRSR